MPVPLHVRVHRRRDKPRDLPSADLRTWEKLLELAGDDSVQRTALLYLRDLLGADYGGLCTSTSLAMTLMTRFQDGPPECVRLYEMLRQLEDQRHLRTVVGRQLGCDGTQYLHGMTVIELAAAARVRGIPIHIYPPGGNGSQPDPRRARSSRRCPGIPDEALARGQCMYHSRRYFRSYVRPAVAHASALPWLVRRNLRRDRSRCSSVLESSCEVPARRYPDRASCRHGRRLRRSCQPVAVLRFCGSTISTGTPGPRCRARVPRCRALPR